MTVEEGALDRLEEALRHKFEDRELLKLALMHRSYASEAGLTESYERLEFLGDAVLQLAVTTYLYGAYPDLAEGEITALLSGLDT